jgi:hypothetical protein
VRTGLKGDTPRAPDTLVRFAPTNVLSGPRLAHLSPADDGASVDVKKLVKRLQPARDKVHALAGDALREARELQQTQAARNAAIERAVETFDGVAGTASALLDLVGESALAERTRPSARRSGVTRPKRKIRRSTRRRPPDARTTPARTPSTARQDQNDRRTGR